MATHLVGAAAGSEAAEHALPVRRWNARRVGLALAGVAVLALAVGVHAFRLAQTPGWDPQEGYNLDLAWNLLHWRLRLFGLSQAFAAHPPLFYLQLALLIHLFGYSIATIRALAGVYAVLTCGVVLAFGRRVVGAGPALWAGLVFAGVPLFLENTRWGYSYAQLMLVGLLCLWATWRYLETRARRWLLVAALLAGLAVLSDYEGLALVLFVALVAWRVRWRDLGLTLSVGLGLPLIGLLACFAVAPAVFVADFAATFGRAAGGNFALQVVEWLVNYYGFVTLSPWVVLGLVGLALARPARARVFLLVALAVLGAVVLKVREVGLSLHTVVPLLPLLALGAGVALDAAVRLLYAGVRAYGPGAASPQRQHAGQRADSDAPRRQNESQRAYIRTPLRTVKSVRVSIGKLMRAREPVAGPEASDMRAALLARARNLLAALVVFVAVVSPLAIALAVSVAGVATTLATPNDALLATDPAAAQAAGAYVLAHERSGDLTLGSPQVVWPLDQPDDAAGQPRPLYAADLLQTLAYSGQPAAFYPGGLPRALWAFAVSLDRARYVIVDNLLRRLAAPGEVANLAPLLATVEAWP
ncbi:MAG TPA: glycosyltransferase family 39 protein, partial [Ktedonobacterales bacterium]